MHLNDAVAASQRGLTPQIGVPEVYADEAELSFLLSLLGIGADKMQTSCGTAPHLQPAPASHQQQPQELQYERRWHQGLQQEGQVVHQLFGRRQAELALQTPAATPTAWPIATLLAPATQQAVPLAVMAATEIREHPPPQPEDDSCVVCMEGPKEFVLVPCGHQALCKACTLGLLGPEGGGGGQRECLICRVAVAHYVLQVFRC